MRLCRRRWFARSRPTFKAVSDTYGHDAGYQLLQQIGRRLRSAVRPQDLLVRYAGDKFVVLWEDLPDGDAAALVRRLREALADPFQLGDRQVRIAMSIGTAVASQRVAGDELLREADRVSDHGIPQREG